MKLDFFNRFFGGERKQKSVELNPDELRVWLGKKIKSRKDEVYRECRPLIGDISRHLAKVRALTLGLEGSECPKEIPEKARKILRTSKPAFVHGILDAISTIEDKKPSGYGELKRFHRDLHATVSALGKIAISQGRYLPIAFGEEIDNIRMESKRLLDKSEELGDKLDSEVGFLSEASKELDEIDVGVEKLKNLDVEKSNVEGELMRCSKKKSDLKAEIDSLHKTRESEELNKAEEELKKIRKEIDLLESDIYNCINPLKRSMKKFRRFAEVKGYNPQIIKNIDGYMENPVGCFLSDETKNLENVLFEIRKAVELEDFKVKGRDRDKISLKIESTLAVDKDNLRRRHRKLKILEREIFKKIESFSVTEKRKELERNLEDMEREIRTYEDEINRMGRKRGDIRGDVSRGREELERKLNSIEGYEIKVIWSDF